jgi:hypothetical protein
VVAYSTSIPICCRQIVAAIAGDVLANLKPMGGDRRKKRLQGKLKKAGGIRTGQRNLLTLRAKADHRDPGFDGIGFTRSNRRSGVSAFGNFATAAERRHLEAEAAGQVPV